MNASDNKNEDHRHNASDRRTPKGRRASDRGEESNDGIEEVSVPEHRRRKSVRRSGEDRRNPR